MSPFKEPQPRKNSAAEDAKKVIGGNWPPYAREGGEANWAEKPISEAPSPNAQWTMSEVEFYQSLETAREEGRAEAVSDLEYRSTALEAAGTLYAGTFDLSNFWPNVLSFEAYLRDGAKPS